MDLAPIMDELRAFVAERDWAQFHDPKNLAMALASEAGELVALLRWIKGEEADAFARGAQREALAAEIADVAITLLLLVDRVGLDLPSAVRAKLEVQRRKYPVELSRGRADRP